MSRFITMLALFILAGCASIPSPELRNVTIEADVSTQIAGNFHYRWDGVDYHGGHVGRVAVVLDQPISRELVCRVGIEHRSLLDTNRDRGEERAIVGFTWRPFR